MPLTQAGCQQRRERLLTQVNADTIIISNPRHVQYLCGYWVTPLEIGTWGTPHLIIDGSTGTTTLIAHDFTPHLDSAYVDSVSTWHWYDGISAPDMPLFPKMVSQLTPHLQGKKAVAYESGWLPHGALTGDGIDITATILSMRRHKDPDELEMIRACVRAVEAGHRAARTTIRPGATEIEVYNAFYAAVVTEAGESVLPLGDYASGERAFEGEGAPSARTINSGDVMIIDAYPVIGGYRADFTATYAAAESLTEPQARLESALHAGVAAAESLLKSGASASAIYNAVKVALDDAGFAGAFPHHAGHGLGLGHPEAPFLVPDSDEVLQTGDVITIEPGAYGDDFGGRIEHNYLITADGYERLTNHDTAFVGA